MTTIKDVARMAGVSVATVSRAYNASRLLRAETLERVLTAGRTLGYAPHAGARSLVTRRTSGLGVLLPDLYGEFFSEVIRGIDQAARAEGYHLLLASARDHGPDFRAALRSMRGRVDGLVVMAPDLTADPSEGLADRFPVVLLNSPPTGARADQVTVANHAGARAMVRHLVARGHRRIAFVAGAAGNYDAAERLRGYRDGLREARLPREPELELDGDFSEAAGHAAALRVLAMRKRPTALFAANDGMAIGALSALRDRGEAVPGDIAVVGFDDIPMARYVDPALTTVHVDIEALGARATARLLAALAAPERHRPRRETLPTTLVVRRSCGTRRR